MSNLVERYWGVWKGIKLFGFTSNLKNVFKFLNLKIDMFVLMQGL